MFFFFPFGWDFSRLSANPGSLYTPRGAGLTFPELWCRNAIIQAGGCAQPLAPVQLLAQCLCCSHPTKAPLFPPFQEGNGGGGRNEIKVLPAEMVNSRLETGEAAGEQRERQCRLWVTLNTGCWGRALRALISQDIYTFLSHSLLPQQRGGEPCPPQHLQQQVELKGRGLE